MVPTVPFFSQCEHTDSATTVQSVTYTLNNLLKQSLDWDRTLLDWSHLTDSSTAVTDYRLWCYTKFRASLRARLIELILVIEALPGAPPVGDTAILLADVKSRLENRGQLLPLRGAPLPDAQLVIRYLSLYSPSAIFIMALHTNPRPQYVDNVLQSMFDPCTSAREMVKLRQLAKSTPTDDDSKLGTMVTNFIARLSSFVPYAIGQLEQQGPVHADAWLQDLPNTYERLKNDGTSLKLKGIQKESNNNGQTYTFNLQPDGSSWSLDVQTQTAQGYLSVSEIPPVNQWPAEILELMQRLLITGTIKRTDLNVVYYDKILDTLNADQHNELCESLSAQPILDTHDSVPYDAVITSQPRATIGHSVYDLAISEASGLTTHGIWRFPNVSRRLPWAFVLADGPVTGDHKDTCEQLSMPFTTKKMATQNRKLLTLLNHTTQLSLNRCPVTWTMSRGFEGHDATCITGGVRPPTVKIQPRTGPLNTTSTTTYYEQRKRDPSKLTCLTTTLYGIALNKYIEDLEENLNTFTNSQDLAIALAEHLHGISACDNPPPKMAKSLSAASKRFKNGVDLSQTRANYVASYCATLRLQLQALENVDNLWLGTGNLLYNADREDFTRTIPPGLLKALMQIRAEAGSNLALTIHPGPAADRPKDVATYVDACKHWNQNQKLTISDPANYSYPLLEKIFPVNYYAKHNVSLSGVKAALLFSVLASGVLAACFFCPVLFPFSPVLLYGLTTFFGLTTLTTLATEAVYRFNTTNPSTISAMPTILC